MVYTGKSGGGSCLEPVALEPVADCQYAVVFLDDPEKKWPAKSSCFFRTIYTSKQQNPWLGQSTIMFCWGCSMICDSHPYP